MLSFVLLNAAAASVALALNADGTVHVTESNATIHANQADYDYVKEQEPRLLGTNTYAQAITYAKTHPTRDGGSWNGWCGALMVRAGNIPDRSVCPSAIQCYRRSTIVSHNINAAPSGAFHWWNIGADGHVAMATTNGWSMMASCRVSESWGNCIGVTSVSGYTAQTGAGYLGWSYDYAGSEIADVRRDVTPGKVPKTSTASDGIPGINYYKRQQLFASKHGYSGPLDGSLGVQSWAGTQRGLAAYGYTGPADGKPGPNTYKAMQRLAARYGYSGPIDGSLGPNSYKGIATYFNTL